MKSGFSLSWLSSSQPRKQRKFRFNAPLHIRGKFVNSTLSKELREKYETRNVRVRKGDKVKILRGQFKGKTGTVEKVSLAKTKVFISGVELAKKDGAKVKYPIHPSNLMITTLNTEDKKRLKNLKQKKSD